MPLDQAGRVIVSPNAPLGLPEFQQLYSSMGANPEEAAANINLRFPTEAKSRLSQAWSQLNINRSPEQYFSSPQPASGGRPAYQPPLAPGAPNPTSGTTWPMFQNEAQRNIALNTIDPKTGEALYDPTYASPLKRAEAAAFEASRSNDMGVGPGSIAMMGRANNPVDPNADDPHLLGQQLAGDSSGDTKRVLQSLQHGLAPGELGPKFGQEEALNMPAGMRPQVNPYHPLHGIGGAPNEEALTSTLDTNLISDPEFQALTVKDPHRAGFVYEQLTGRKYDNDLKLHNTIRGKQAQVGISMVAEGIKNGDHKDPRTGKWMVWETREAPAGAGAGSIGEPKAYRQLVPANPEKQRMYDRYYTPATGMQPTARIPATRGQQAGSAMAMRDPEIAAAVAARAKEFGHGLSHQEILGVANDVRNKQTPVSGIGHVLNAAATAGEYVNDATKWNPGNKVYGPIIQELVGRAHGETSGPVTDMMNSWMGSDSKTPLNPALAGSQRPLGF